jgi:hypothetical protein
MSSLIRTFAVPFLRRLPIFLCLPWLALCIPISLSTPAVADDGFQPVSSDELKMTSEPLAPGAPAIILYRQVDRDDSRQSPHEFHYFRIKILTEEGRKYADVEIPFDKDDGFKVVKIGARTIKADGSIRVQRVHSIYFQFSFEKLDDVTIAMPLGWQIASLPAAQKQDGQVVAFTSAAETTMGPCT